jgi:hypothetical protein
MRSRWEELHAGLLRSIDRRESVGSFEDLQRRSRALAPFRRPAEIAAFLASKASSLVERDRVLRCLVEEATRGSAKRLALAIVLLGSWPALDSIFRKRGPLFQRQGLSIELEIIEQFIAQVQRVDLARVSCLAATLVRSTEREVVDACVRECARSANHESVTPDAIAAPAIGDEPPRSRFGLAVAQSEAEHVAALRRWLQAAVGHDADLVVDAVIHQRSRLELAAALSISHAAARKRLERALERARHAFLHQMPSQGAAPAASVSR